METHYYKTLKTHKRNENVTDFVTCMVYSIYTYNG